MWPSGGKKIKMGEIGGFLPSIVELIIIQFISNLGYSVDLNYNVGCAGPIWPSGGWRMPRDYWNRWFPTIIWSINHSMYLKVSVYIKWMSLINDLFFGRVCPISAIWWQNNDCNWSFPIMIWNTHSTSNFVCINWVGNQKWFDFGSCSPIFSPMVATK